MTSLPILAHATTPATRWVSIFVFGLLTLTGCGTADTGPDPPQATPTSASPTPSPTPSVSATPDKPEPTAPDVAVPSLAGTCTVDDSDAATAVTVAYPEGWRVSNECRYFDPHTETVEPGTEPDVAVAWRIAEVSFEEATDLRRELDDVAHFVGARSGYQAVRVRGVATGQGLRPAGTPTVQWLVDLDEGGTLIGSARPAGRTAANQAAAVLDRMAETLLIRPPAARPDNAIVVTRQQTGPTAYTVTFDGTCFRLHDGGPEAPVQQEACDLEVSDQQPATVLLHDDLPVLTGLVSALANRVSVPAASGSFGAVTQPLEGASAFAMRVRQPPFELTITDATGRTLSTTPIHPQSAPSDT